MTRLLAAASIALAALPAVAQIAHPTVYLDGGVKIYLYPIDIQLANEGPERQESRQRRIDEWKSRQAIKAIEYQDVRTLVQVGGPFFAMSPDDQRELASTVATHARKSNSSSEYVHIVDAGTGKLLAVFSLTFGRLRWEEPVETKKR